MLLFYLGSLGTRTSDESLSELPKYVQQLPAFFQCVRQIQLQLSAQAGGREPALYLTSDSMSLITDARRHLGARLSFPRRMPVHSGTKLNHYEELQLRLNLTAPGANVLAALSARRGDWKRGDSRDRCVAG